MRSLGRTPGGARLERVRASPRFAQDRFVNLHPIEPGLRDPNVPMPTLREFLCGGERRQPPGRAGRYDGLALIFGGIGLVILSTVRFVRTTRLLDDAAAHDASSVRTELILCAFLVLVVASYGIYLAFG